MVSCPVCGNDVGNEKFCPNCGSAVDDENTVENNSSSTQNTKYCSNCGSEIDFKAEICPKCGVRQKSASVSSSEKNEVLAIILSFILPGLGHFYLGLPKKGIIILILSIVGIFLFIFPYLIVWAYGMYDAYKSATLIIQGQTVEDKLF